MSCLYQTFWQFSVVGQEESGSDEELLQNGGELAGMKVKHNAEELNSGETMILTLADRNILDDKGEIIDDAEELENTLVVSLKLTCWSFHASHFLESSDTAQPTMQRTVIFTTSLGDAPTPRSQLLFQAEFHVLVLHRLMPRGDVSIRRY